MEQGRQVTLVVLDEAGRLEGVSRPFPVPLPWWQEVGPITEVAPGLVVLRLLAVDPRQVTVDPESGGQMGGRTVYLAQRQPGGRAETGREPALEPWPGALPADLARHVAQRLRPHPLRQPWAEPGGPAADLEWASSKVTVTGPAVQHRSWNLSAIWSIPTTIGPVWLKCVPSFFAHEAAAIQLLDSPSVPRLVAADGHRILMENLPGEDGYEADLGQQIEMIETLVELQAGTIGRVEGFIERGVPDLRAGPLAEELTGLVERIAPDARALRQLVDDIPRRMEAATECGIPDALVHGDPHGGNCRRGVHPPVWFDWGDSFVGNPLLDVAATHRMAEPVVERWIRRWSEIVPGSEPARAWPRLRPVAALLQAWIYQRFLDGIEPSEHIYHRDDVGRALAEAEAVLGSQ